MGNVIEIHKNIVAVRLRSGHSAPPAAAEDIDPRRVVYPRREEGAWESVTVKMKPPGGALGQQTFYFVIGFGEVCGRIDGESVCIERPLEFFMPASQTEVAQEWITATFRSLSLAARGGYVAQALEDLRQIESSTPVWHGKSAQGKGLRHGSIVAAIAWRIQRELHRRGFLDDRGRENELDVMCAQYQRYRRLRQALPVDNPVDPDSAAPPTTSTPDSPQAVVGRCRQPGCGGDIILLDGCRTCLDCGDSKCG